MSLGHRVCCCPGVNDCVGFCEDGAADYYELVLSGLSMTPCSCWDHEYFDSSAQPGGYIARKLRHRSNNIIDEDLNNDGAVDLPYLMQRSIGSGTYDSESYASLSNLGYGCCWKAYLLQGLGCTACEGGNCEGESMSLRAFMWARDEWLELIVIAESDTPAFSCAYGNLPGTELWAAIQTTWFRKANVFSGRIYMDRPYECMVERTFTNLLTECPNLMLDGTEEYGIAFDHCWTFATGGTATITPMRKIDQIKGRWTGEELSS